jgi:hypothetical protein
LEFTLHHTCSSSGDKDSIIENVPFLSKYKPEDKIMPYLGEGYYFWDYNLEYAMVWGESHYSNKYFILECEVNIDCDDETYLDLVGNRKHLVGFVSLLMEFNLIHEEGTKGIDLCYIIEYLRKYCPPEVFPFKIIRAVDYKNEEKAGIKIVFNGKGQKPSFTILNPRIIFAFKNRDEIPYKLKPFITFAS